ncbi:hypothetical protein DLJ60_05425 [Micromonospora chalcea]|uniref:Uncharacterized protein n=1 Tax=Micromonospora chalcea TaxID=1874 RepID=A0ABX9Y8L2_MICCH|nr:hypothetical protein DLJ60_05425 [Micromonospora chalcea]
MSWQATQPELEPAPVGGGRVMPSPFPINGRQAVERFVEFGRELAEALPLDAGPYTAIVEVQLAHRSRWSPLVSFPLHTELVKSQDSARLFVTRSNNPAWLP